MIDKHPEAWNGCDINHMTSETCPLAVNSSFSVTPKEFYTRWKEIQRHQQAGRQVAKEIASKYNGTRIVEMRWRDVVCGQTIPSLDWPVA